MVKLLAFRLSAFFITMSIPSCMCRLVEVLSIKHLNVSLLSASLLLASAGQAHAGYTFTDLGLGSSASGINNAGQVVGTSYTWGDVWRATLWSGTTITDLGTLPGGSYSAAFAINNAGQIAGASTRGGDADSYLHPTLWSGGTVRELGEWGIATGINNAGQVVGYSAYNSSTMGLVTRATLWSGGTPVDLGTLGGNSSEARGINDAGQVVGYSEKADYGAQAFLWNGVTLASQGEARSIWAKGINNAGQVVGASYVNGELEATLWSGATETYLGHLGGHSSSANAINNAGQVVGYSSTPDGEGRATLWNGVKATDLNSFMSLSNLDAGWVMTEATGINDNGWIIGNISNASTGEYRAFMLSVTAVPEPETYAMLLAGLGLIGGITRRNKRKSPLV